MRVAFTLFLTILLTACASSGTAFNIEQANQVKNGMTREQVVEVMEGPPFQVRNQGKTLTWSYAKVGFFGGTESRAVKFEFNEEGKTYGIPEGGAFGDAQKVFDME